MKVPAAKCDYTLKSRFTSPPRPPRLMPCELTVTTFDIVFMLLMKVQNYGREAGGFVIPILELELRNAEFEPTNLVINCQNRCRSRGQRVECRVSNMRTMLACVDPLSIYRD